MELGAFSISLTVKDIEASKAFYEKLGFKVFVGDNSQNWLIMKKRRAHDRFVSRDVREEYLNFQSWLGQ